AGRTRGASAPPVADSLRESGRPHSRSECSTCGRLAPRVGLQAALAERVLHLWPTRSASRVAGRTRGASAPPIGSGVGQIPGHYREQLLEEGKGRVLLGLLDADARLAD